MESDAEARSSGQSNPFSRLDWPTPATLLPAHRARGRLLRELIVKLAAWAGAKWSGSKFDSRREAGSGAIRID